MPLFCGANMTVSIQRHSGRSRNFAQRWPNLQSPQGLVEKDKEREVTGPDTKNPPSREPTPDETPSEPDMASQHQRLVRSKPKAMGALLRARGTRIQKTGHNLRTATLMRQVQGSSPVPVILCWYCIYYSCATRVMERVSLS